MKIITKYLKSVARITRHKAVGLTQMDLFLSGIENSSKLAAMKVNILLLILFSSILLLSCSEKNKQSSVQFSKQPVSKAVTSDESFRMPEIPSTLNTPEARADYLMEHYWDNFAFNDTSMISKPKLSEQAFADFINILNNIPPLKAEKGITTLMDKAGISRNMLLYFQKLSEKYLYDPNSPVRNEQLFEYFLLSVISSSAIDETHKIRPTKQLEIVLKNKPGTIATDFSYTLPDGSTHKLSTLNAGLIVIYFNNPECHDCSTVKEKFSISPVINELNKKDILKILAVYTDEDIAIYKKHLSEMPSEWINAYNKGAVIKNKELYDLKAIPTIYLLDKNKTVLLKDVTFETLEAYLMHNSH